MKDTAINYDLVHQQQQHQQQQQQQQQHSWNHQRQQQHQTHTTSVYSNHSANQTNSQRNAIGGHHQQHHHHHHSQQQQQQQGQQHTANPLGQYQQLQPATHHNTAAAAAAYYQQAHLYPTYQAHSQDQSQQQQQAGSEHHHHGASVNATGAPTSVVNAVVASSQQQHTGMHQSTGNQASALNHTGWSQGLAAQPHHAVVTDHSTLAYMTHAYQSHNSSVNDHRNANASISNQLLGTGPQASSYTVDSLYNTPAAAAAAVAAYGYNNYNAAFFQTSNNGPHAQTGHPSPAGFWGHTQNQQQRTSHTQAVSNQAPLQQRQQQMTTDQASNYIHDPRMYYGRTPYNQGLQNFTQPHSQTQHQPDVVHHRMKTLNQPSMVQHHDQQLQQMTQTQQHLLHATNLVTQQTPTNQNSQLDQQQSNVEHSSSSQSTSGQNPQHARKIQSLGVSPQHQSSIIQSSDEIDTNLQETRNASEYDQVNQMHHTIQQSNLSNQKSSQQMVSNSTSYGSTVTRSTAANDIQEVTPSSLSPVNKSMSVIKSDSSGQYQSRKPSSNSPPQAQLKNSYKAPHSEISKPQPVEVTKKVTEKDQSSTTNSDQKASTIVRQDSSERQPDPLESSMASLAITTRKTTWASIASQPAKVSQPKSLKSKIAGSNSVFSSAKHLTSVSSMDSSSLESKNSINPAIKSSVSAAATSIPRSSVPPPISKATPPPNLNLKLDILGESESGKISWPAVNASINLTLDEPIPKKEEPPKEQSVYDERYRKDDTFKARDHRDQTFRDHNHNHGSNRNNNHQRRDDYWQRRDQREFNRIRRDSDRKEIDFEKKQVDLHDDSREHSLPKRDMKVGNNRINQFRGGDEPPHHRDRNDYNKRGGLMLDRVDRPNDSYRNARFPPHRQDHPREINQRHSNNGENAPHHHYNNVRDGNSSRNPQTKPDLKLHPHLNPANFNPKQFDCEPENARYFIIKSYSEDDIHRSIKYSIWCSTNHGNKRLDEAYRQQQAKNGQLFLFFSVNGSGHFCGMAQMMSPVDFDSSSGVWAQSKWQGEFSVKWIFVKDVPNSALRHITLENNEDKPVTNSRDTQEVPNEKGKAVLKILHQYNHTTSIFDDFLHYERRQEEEKLKKSSHVDQAPNHRSEERGMSGERANIGGARFNNRPYVGARGHNDFHSSRERPSRFAS